jgi:hypothetical protein
MSLQDPARLIAERVARRLAGASPQTPTLSETNGSQTASPSRARIINFVSSSPPPPTESRIPITTAEPAPERDIPGSSVAPLLTQSPWLAPFSHISREAFGEGNRQSTIATPQSADHPSQERFGIDEAAVSELVEFFENEKMCTVDPSGKPCDHCAMCSSRGF